MQNAGITALGLNWRYLAFDVHPNNLAAAIAGAQAMKFLGLNLTIPHKLPAFEMVDALDESARLWGAVNTIRFEARDEKGEWQPLRDLHPAAVTEARSHGFNTDAEAIVQSLNEELGCNLTRATVLVLGAGGAGRVACLKLAAEGVSRLFLVNRTARKATEIATEIHSRFPGVNVEVAYPEEPVDLIVNATSLGLRVDDPLPLDPGKFNLKKAGAVFDMIYRPAETKLLRAAKASGCRTANGLGMLLYQGAKALEIWTGQPPPVEAMREALRTHVYGK
jgi:shikimate dehydrogenase